MVDDIDEAYGDRVGRIDRDQKTGPFVNNSSFLCIDLFFSLDNRGGYMPNFFFLFDITNFFSLVGNIFMLIPVSTEKICYWYF